ncbi:MAG: glycosyltransferase [Actinomycetota bacterium]|nr:glycosyltransferase [Actinomycetota bacterium]
MRRPPVIVLAGIRWDFLWQRHQTLATRFAHAGYPTVFVETTGLSNPSPGRATLRKVLSRLGRYWDGGKGLRGRPGLTVYSPLVVPPTLETFRRANRRIFLPRVLRDLEKVAGPSPVVVAYPPTRTTLDLISGLGPRLVLYDCADDYEHFPGAPRDIRETERELLRRADLVSCTSTYLLRRVRPLRPDAFLSGPAADYERFAALQASGGVEEVRTVCFFGHVSRERIDFSALRAIAGAGFVVRLVGGLGRMERDLLKMPGVDYRGEVSHAGLPAALRGADAFVLPYRINGLTRGISPAKTYECLATGKPIVAAPLPAIEELAGHVYLARRPEDYVKVLRSLRETEEKALARIELARKNSWDARFAEVEEVLWRAL